MVSGISRIETGVPTADDLAQIVRAEREPRVEPV
jgi:hypothetical protein